MAMLCKLILNGIKVNRGSVTIMAIGVMMFLGVILSGVLPMITQEVRSGTMNRDVVEAQYAAEAGAKRALVEFEKINKSLTPDWSWLTIDKPFLANAAEKKYNVITYLQSDAMKQHVTPVTTATNTYVVQSTGRVNGAEKKISVVVTVTAGVSVPPVSPVFPADTAIYAGGNIEFKNNGVVNNASTVAGENNSDSYNLGGSNAGVPYKKEQYKKLTLPQYTASSFPGAKSIPGGSNPALNGQYVVNGDWDIGNNTNFTGDATIFVTGNIVLPQNFNFNGKFLIIAAENIDGDKSNNNNFGNAILLAYGNIDFKNNLNINGTMMAGGDVSFKNNANVNYDSSLALHFGLPTSLTGGGGSSGTAVSGLWSSN